MAKTIVFLADGTWNGTDVDKDDDGLSAATNVLKLYHNLAGDDSIGSWQHSGEGERVLLDGNRNTLQIAKYLHGVGDSKNVFKKLLGGAFGTGLISRIVRGYTFISRNYEPGDRIVIAGFSRGAYTARALGGMITKAGLMDYAKLNIASKEQAYCHGFYVWAYYRQQRVLRLDSDIVSNLWLRVQTHAFQVGEEHMITNVPIDAIGVWDTVGSLGLPIYGNENKRMDLFRFADTDLNPLVKRGFHALAIDERRADFDFTPWTARAGIEQRWFIGGHGDTGGGYEEAQLSDIAYEWMAERLAMNGTGLAYKSPLPVLPAPDFRGPIHDESRRLPFSLAPKIRRAIPAGADIDGSVIARRNDTALGYAPANVP